MSVCVSVCLRVCVSASLSLCMYDGVGERMAGSWVCQLEASPTRMGCRQVLSPCEACPRGAELVGQQVDVKRGDYSDSCLDAEVYQTVCEHAYAHFESVSEASGTFARSVCTCATVAACKEVVASQENARGHRFVHPAGRPSA